MASVYYLFDDALHIADDIVDKYSQQDKNQKENHYAATVIQRTYRGHVVRKRYLKYVQQVIVVQKYIRGWLVRYHLPDVLQQFWDAICLKKYHENAVKIQAVWRGKLVRNEIDIKKIMEEKRRAEETVQEVLLSSSIDEFPVEIEVASQKSSDNDVPFGGAPLGQKRFLQQQILELMFDRHHLLSTQVKAGILDANQELKEIEKVLKSLHWKDYIEEERRLYYKYEQEKDSRKPLYRFANKKMQRQEDLMRLRDKSYDLKEVNMNKFVVDNRKPFNLYAKIEAERYQRNTLAEGKYVKPIRMITRTEDKSQNISKKDFVLTLKEISKRCDIPPYYADFWYRECIGHQLLD